MLIYYPSYYKDFKCIADKCPDTCCSMWQVVVDSETAEFYKSLKGEFGDKLRSSMYVDEDGDIVFRNKDDSCPFLNSKRLCDIHSNIGEENTPCTCKKFPRFTITYGMTEYRGLSMSCPVAAKLIVNDKMRVDLVETNDDLPNPDDIVDERVRSIRSAKSKSLIYIKNGRFTNKKIHGLIGFAKTVDEYAANEMYDDIFKLEVKDFENSSKIKINHELFDRFEYLTPEGEKLIKSFNSNSELKPGNKLTNIVRYYIKRYSFIDDEIYFWFTFGVLSTMIIGNIAQQKGIKYETVARIYSKEIEHSQYNIDILRDYIYMDL